jgi:phage tail-like protein
VSDRAPSGGSKPDPVGELSFRVTVKDAEIGKFSECTGLTVEYETLDYQEGGQNSFTHKFRSRLKYPNLVLKRGVTSEDALFKWFFASKKMGSRGEMTIELIAPDGGIVRRWAVAEPLPVKWTGPNLNAGSSSVATETLEVAHHGFLP